MKQKEGNQGEGGKPEVFRRFNSATRTLVEEGLEHWLGTYKFEGGNLGLTGKTREERIMEAQFWVTGTFGRAKHQFLDSGIKGLSSSNPYAEALIGYFFYEYLSAKPEYPEIRADLPAAIRMHDPALATPKKDQ